MADPDKAVTTMIRNVEQQTGKSLAQFRQIIAKSGLSKHGEIRAMLMEKFELGHGQANAVVHLALESDGQSAAAGKSTDAVLDEIYAEKPDLRPIHDAITAVITALGEFEVAPKKGYVSYRRRKQFAMVGPKTKTAIEVGLAAKKLASNGRLKEMPAMSMCRYTTRVSSLAEVDSLLKGWLQRSFDEAE